VVAAAPQQAVAAEGIATTILSPGDTSSPTPERGQSVVVDYVLWLDSFGGKRIDGNNGFSFRAGTGQVIRGWDLTVSEMHVNERRRVVIPASLGYGNAPTGPIPGGSDLYFDITLRDLKPTPAQLEAKAKAAAALRTPEEQGKLDKAALQKKIRAERMAEEARKQSQEYQRVFAGRDTFGSTYTAGR
jgi:FKBP-type peptidyl-prolyl cis-trans isomerase